MPITIINDWRFKQHGDVRKGMEAAADLVRYFDEHEPKVRLSLWTRDREEPHRYFHITIFDDYETFQRVVKSQAISDFVEKLYPEMDESTHVAPQTDVVLSSGGELDALPLTL